MITSKSISDISRQWSRIWTQCDITRNESRKARINEILGRYMRGISNNIYAFSMRTDADSIQVDKRIYMAAR